MPLVCLAAWLTPAHVLMLRGFYRCSTASGSSFARALVRAVTTFIFACVAMAGSPFEGAATSDPLLQQALAAEAAFDSATALKCFLQLDAQKPDDGFVLQKISRQYSDLTLDTRDEAEKQRLCEQALQYSQRAATVQPNNAVNQLSLAICYGKLAGYSSTRRKLEYSKLVKRHADEALRLDPSYDYAYHVLGRWHYEVASLGAGTRFLVKLIYGGLPPASTAEAVRLLARSTELAPDLPSHRVELGFALLADGQINAAMEAFSRALSMARREKYDLESFARARNALATSRP